MAQTLAEQLTQVQAAITAIEGGSQSYSVNGLSVTRADLDRLYKRERDLLDRIEGATRQSRTIAQF